MEINDIISSGLLELYVLGMTSPAESQQVREWAEQYPEVSAEILTVEESLKTYAVAEAIQPNPALKDQFMNKINFKNSAGTVATNDTTAKLYSISPIWKRAAAAAILLLIGSVILNIVYYNRYKEADLAYNDANQQLLAQTEKVNILDKDMSVVQNKYSVPVALNGLEKAPDAAAKIFWMKNTGEVYIDPSNLPKAPQGKQYQLWAIVDGKPVDGGMIAEGKDGQQYHIQKMKTFGKAEAFAVTLETTGGNPTPKGDMYVMGKML